MIENQILQGDALAKLRELPDETVHCCVTSPPYWGLRDYGVEGQIGLEGTPEEYVGRLVDVFREVRRVLRGDGTLWLNLGDCYASSPPGNTKTGVEKRRSSGLHGVVSPAYAETLDLSVSKKRNTVVGNLKPKDLCGIPWRVAFALQAPYERHVLPQATDRSWMAAMIDAEGCITVPECKSPHGSGSSYPPVVQIRMCDTEALERCVELTGKGGNLHEQLPPSYAEANQRPAYQWRISGRTAADVLADAYPFLLIKRKQAAVAWTLQNIRESYETKRGAPVPEDALTKQITCRDLIKKLNQREPANLPSWIEEPRFIVGPGWYLRQDCIWHKPNPMPESVTDRCTKAHEYVFLLSKSERYCFDHNAISEPAKYTQIAGMDGSGFKPPQDFNGKHSGCSETLPRRKAVVGYDDGRRNRRSVWTIATSPFPEAHFAVFPEELVQPCILAGCPEGGIVLDPFMGSGTVALVALKANRRYIGIELNPEYIKIAEDRIWNEKNQGRLA